MLTLGSSGRRPVSVKDVTNNDFILDDIRIINDSSPYHEVEWTNAQITGEILRHNK